MLNCLKFHHIKHDTTASTHQQVYPVLAKMISWDYGLLPYCMLKTRSNFS